MTEDQANYLKSPFSKKEAFYAMKNLKSNVAPEPDGFSTIFYPNYWNIVGDEISSFISSILNNQENPKFFITPSLV